MHMCYNDSVIQAWASEKPDLPAPACSEHSAEDYDANYSTDEEADELMANGKADPKARFKKIDPRFYDINNFDMDVMREFPHKFRDGEVPYKILRVDKKCWALDKYE